MRQKILTILIIFGSFFAFSQGELPEKEEIFYKDERSFAVKINSNGWGMNFRNGKFVNPKNKNLWEIDFNTLRHIKEVKMFTISSSKRYVYGKTNYCFDFRYGLGRQRRLYKKHDKGSVEIRMVYFLGGALGFMKPIYYEIDDNGTVVTEQFQPNHQHGTILDRKSFSWGLFETKINPGMYFKIGISFEHSKYETQLSAIELGINTYAYLNKMELMAEIPNNRFFATLYLNYRFGAVFHGGHHKKLNKKEDVL